MHKLSKLQAPLSHYILEARSLAMVKAFVASGIDLNETNEQGLSVLYSACKVGVFLRTGLQAALQEAQVNSRL